MLAVETTVPWLYENAWLIPALPAASFVLILFFGKRLPYKGAEIGLAAVGAAFVLALLTTFAWIGDVQDDVASGGAEHGEEAPADGEGSSTDEEHGSAPLGDVLVSADGNPLASVTLTAATATAAEEAEEGGHGPARGAAVVSDVQWFESGLNVFRVGIQIDGQSVMLLFVVTIVSGLVHIYSTDYVDGDRRYTHYFAFLSLFTAAMLFMVLASSTLQLIVGWELVGVCSFVLIGHWWEEKPNSDAAVKAFLTNRVGDIGLLIGVITLFFAAGQTFSIVEINSKAVSGEISSTALTVAAVALMAAVMSKSGQFVLHTWLPDAMAGPTPVSALIHAATMVVAGVYMIGRLYPVFYEGLSISGSNINLMAFIGGLTTVGGGLLAFVQRDIKKVLAYSTVSQLGYMVLALGMGAYTAGMFHLFTHAFFKACLFLGAGSVSHACHHSFDMKSDMGGLRKHMPITFWTFLIGSAALAGIPPLAGFWSKDEILAGAGVWPGTGGNGTYLIPFIFGMMTAAMTAAYMTRTIWLTFFGEYRGHEHPHESGKRITVPLIIL
ncbi:MAG: NADH-quinone oxidoreductase subunit L, partial [Actinomycetia bacterium]|nr:NADH-quinone oxidoreductase subunit L [Actinomycetes bacterium]